MYPITQTFLAASLSLAAAVALAAPGHSGGSATAHAAEAQPFTITLGLSGYSPVSYLEKNRAEPGSPRFAMEHEGVAYFFTSEKQVATFSADPDRYMPAYGGYCAFGCSVDSKFIPDPTSFEVIDGRTHLFLRNDDVDARGLWNKERLQDVKAKADRYWSSQTASRAYTGARNVPASGVGLDGFSPVSYFTVGHAEKGDPRFAVQHNGVTYHLTSAEQVALFNKNPDRYEPQCDGWCAFGMSVEDKFPVDPTRYKVIDDRLYLFLNNDQVNAFDLWQQGDDATLVKKAQAHWKKVSGS